MWNRETRTAGDSVGLRRHVARCAIIGALFLIASGRDSAADVSIAPALVEVNLNQGHPAGQFVISNLGDAEVRYRIKATHFTFLPNGSLREIAPDEHSLAQWVRFNPTEFTLGPKTRRTIRFVVVPRGPLRAGEYWAAMQLESLDTTLAETKDPAGRQLQLEIKANILAPMFGTFGIVRYGGLVKDARLVGAKGAGQSVQFLFGNTGDGRFPVTAEYEISNSKGETVEKGSIPALPILPHADRILTAALKNTLPAGTYRVRIQCRSSKLKGTIENQFDLVLKPSS